MFAEVSKINPAKRICGTLYRKEQSALYDVFKMSAGRSEGSNTCSLDSPEDIGGDGVANQYERDQPGPIYTEGLRTCSAPRKLATLVRLLSDGKRPTC